MSPLARTASVLGILAAGWGALRLSDMSTIPRTPVPILPVTALLIGAALFAAGVRIADAARGRAPTRVVGSASPRRGFAARITGPATGGIARVPAAAAGAFAVVVPLVYAALGYHPLLAAAWVGSWIAATAAVWPPRGRPGLAPMDAAGRPGASELVFLAILIVAGAVLLFPYLELMPYEISTDEIYLVSTVRAFAEGSETNAFGLVQWWGLPALYFAVAAKVGALTGVSIEGARALSAVTALVTPVPMYVWIRSLHGRRAAMLATAILLFSHAFIAWGRIGLHQNTAVLMLAVAMALLAEGLRRGCRVRLLWGGIALGLGFYGYPSGQVVVLIWALQLAALVAAGRLGRRAGGAVALVTLAGLLLAAGPMLANIVLSFDAFTERARAVAITNPDAVARLGALWGIDASREVVLENMKRGLLSFNVPYSYVTYYNPGNAFVGPAAGALLWLGLGLAAARVRHPGLLCAAVGLAVVYAIHPFTEGAPVHGRLLIALPFVAVLAAEALIAAERALSPARGRAARAGRWLAPAAVGVIAWLDLGAYHDFVVHQNSAARNDAVTAIGRTLGVNIEAAAPLTRFLGQDRRWDPRHHVFYVSSPDSPLFRWGDPDDWHDWVAFFSDSAHVHRVDDVDAFLAPGAADYSQGLWNRITLFLATDDWERNRARLLERYPGLLRTAITPNRRLTAVTIQR